MLIENTKAIWQRRVAMAAPTMILLLTPTRTELATAYKLHNCRWVDEEQPSMARHC